MVNIRILHVFLCCLVGFQSSSRFSTTFSPLFVVIAFSSRGLPEGLLSPGQLLALSLISSAFQVIMVESGDNRALSSGSASSSGTPPNQKKPVVDDWVTAEVLNSKCYFASDSTYVHIDVGGYVDSMGYLSRNDWVVFVPGEDEGCVTLIPTI